eukprot:13400142-Ditylum_brightwellii.AAC.1
MQETALCNEFRHASFKATGSSAAGGGTLYNFVKLVLTVVVVVVDGRKVGVNADEEDTMSSVMSRE